MGPKRQLIVGIVSVILLFIGCVIIYTITREKNKDYCNELISVLSKQEEVTVQDVFTFEFERAYIFNDCYISGEGLAKKYNLDVSINEVKSGVSENVQRIVFVDEAGAFVYVFMCDNSEIFLQEEGMIIYPETVIEKEMSIQEETLIIRFQSSEYYDS